MDSLVLSNIRQRPTRTLISVAGVALGVILVILNTGLVRGMLNDRIRREQEPEPRFSSCEPARRRFLHHQPCRSTFATEIV